LKAKLGTGEKRGARNVMLGHRGLEISGPVWRKSVGGPIGAKGEKTRERVGKNRTATKEKILNVS